MEKYRQFLIALSLSAPLALFANAASAACELSNYILQDQSGKEARVVRVRECFGWIDREDDKLSSQDNLCFTEKRASSKQKALSSRYKHDVRIVGTRLITISYMNRFHTIAETAIIGSPWLSYEVDPDPRAVNSDQFKAPTDIYNLLDGEIEFNFTADAPPGFDSPDALYKSLLGVQFIYKRCQ